VNIHVTHIKGHQDMQTTIFSHPAVLNVRADALATIATNQKNISGELPQFATAALYINGLVVTSKYKKYLRRNYLSMDMRDYLTHANQWKQSTVDIIWWEVHESALLSLSTKKRQFVQKMIHGKLASNYRQIKCISISHQYIQK
jgi:hypothetical protein